MPESTRETVSYFDRLHPREQDIATRMNLSESDLEYLDDIGWQPSDFDISNFESVTQLQRYDLNENTLDRIRGLEQTPEDIARLEDQQRYGKGIKGEIYRLLGEQGEAWRENLRRYGITLEDLKERLNEALGMYDTRSDQAQKDIRQAYKASLGQALQNLVSTGMYNPSATTSFTLGNKEAETAALAREADERLNERINLYSQLSGDVLRWQGQGVDTGSLGLISPLLAYQVAKENREYQPPPATKSWSEAVSSYFTPGNTISMGAPLVGAGIGSLFGGWGGAIGGLIGSRVGGANQNPTEADVAASFGR